MVYFMAVSRKNRDTTAVESGIKSKRIRKVSFMVSTLVDQARRNSLPKRETFVDSLIEGIARNDLSSCRLIQNYHLPNGMNALMMSARDGNVDACKNLIAFGVPLNNQDIRGYTALIYACRDGYTTIARLLLEAGADATIRTKFGYSAIIASSVNGHADIVTILCDNVDPNCTDDDGYSPFICACINNHVSTVLTLIRHGADPSHLDHNGRSGIMHAVDNGNYEILDLLLRNKYYLKYATDSFSCGVLYLSAIRRSRDIVRLLITHSLYVSEFIDDLIRCSNLSAEAVIESEIRSTVHVMTTDEKTQIISVLTIKSTMCINELIKEYSGQPRSSLPLSGLVEASVWANRIHKIMTGPEPAENLEFFWSFVEVLVNACNIQFKHLENKSIKNNLNINNNLNNEGEVLIELSNQYPCHTPTNIKEIKLLFSFIEIYCVGLSGEQIKSEEIYKENLNSFSRLFQMFRKNQQFLDTFTVEYASVYRHMVYFARTYLRFSEETKD